MVSCNTILVHWASLWVRPQRWHAKKACANPKEKERKKEDYHTPKLLFNYWRPMHKHCSALIWQSLCNGTSIKNQCKQKMLTKSELSKIPASNLLPDTKVRSNHSSKVTVVGGSRRRRQTLVTHNTVFTSSNLSLVVHSWFPTASQVAMLSAHSPMLSTEFNDTCSYTKLQNNTIIRESVLFLF